jgi:hypothetical protein
MYRRKTRDVYILQYYKEGRKGLSRRGWAPLHVSPTSEDAYSRMLSYRTMSHQCRYRIIKHRAPKDYRF